jgi:hypothetical protein
LFFEYSVMVPSPLNFRPIILYFHLNVDPFAGASGLRSLTSTRLVTKWVQFSGFVTKANTLSGGALIFTDLLMTDMPTSIYFSKSIS